MSKVINRLMFLFVIVSLLAACAKTNTANVANTPNVTNAASPAGNTDAAGNDKKIEIAVLMPNAGDPYFQTKSYGYIDEAKKLGINIKLYNAGGYGHLPEQIKQIEDLTVKKVDGIILTPTDTTAVVPIINKSIDAGIKVVNDDVLIPNDDKIKVRVSENSFEVGKMEGEMIVEALGGKGNVVMLKGPSDIDLAQQRAKGAKSVFDKTPGIKIIEEQWHKNDIPTGNKLMENIIQAHPNQIDAVYTLGTEAAVGVATAIKSSGIKPGRIAVATIDFTPEIEKMIKDGWVYGSVVCEPVKVARIAVNSVYKLIKGEKVDERINSDSQKVTKANIDTFDRSGIDTPKGWNPTNLYNK